MDDPEFYRLEAEKCREFAEAATRAVDKEEWLRLAAGWLRLAASAEAKAKQRKRGVTS